MDIAGLVRAKEEIVSQDDGDRFEGQEDGFEEVLGGEAVDLCKRQIEDFVEAECRQELDFDGFGMEKEVGDGVEELARVWREGHGYGAPGPASREIDRRLDQVAVSDVDAVEVSDGENSSVIVHVVPASNC